jgi:hypothetical protein
LEDVHAIWAVLAIFGDFPCGLRSFLGPGKDLRTFGASGFWHRLTDSASVIEVVVSSEWVKSVIDRLGVPRDSGG